MKSSVRLIATVAASFLAPQLLAAAEPAAKTAVESSSTLPDANLPSAAGFTSADAASGTSPRLRSKAPRAELFLGYSYLRAVPTYSTGNRFVWLNGGSASLAINLNSYFGIVGDFGGFADSELNLTGPGVATPHVAGSGGKAYTYMGGPRFSFRKSERVTPFVQALFGGMHASEVTLDGCTGSDCVPLPSQNTFAMTAGGGLDVKLQRHLALRVVQAEYLMTRFADPATGTKTMQNDIRLSSGLVFRMGGGPAPLPVSYSCQASPASVYPGDPLSISGTALNLNPKRTPVYTWTGNGGKISGTSNMAAVDTTAAAPGSYTAHGHVSQGSKAGTSADCDAAYTVLAPQPPTVSCSANPSTVLSGQPVAVTAQGVSPQNRPLTYSYTASAGSISGSGSGATLDTTALAPESITITCNVVDDKGQGASATTTATVQAPAIPAAPVTQKLCSIDFTRDAHRPTRVDNEAKACLDDIALNLQRSSDAKVALMGNGTTDQAAQRVVNTREYLVVEKGIDTSRISVYTEMGDGKNVDVTLIPAGAILSTTDLVPVDESVKPVSRRSAARSRSRASRTER